MLSLNLPKAPCSTPAPSSPSNTNRTFAFTPRSIFNTNDLTELSVDSTPSTPSTPINQSNDRSNKFSFNIDTSSPAGFQIHEQPINHSFNQSFERYNDWRNEKEDERSINQSPHALEKSEDEPRERGFHLRGSAKLRLAELESKEDIHLIDHEKIESSESIDQTKQSTNQSLVKKFDFVTEPSNLASDNERLLHLLCCVFRCRECLPTPRDEDDAVKQSNNHSSNEYSSRLLGEFCCVGNALSSSWPSCLPFDLISLTQSYTLTTPTRSFLTHPAPASAGVIQCFILKDKEKNRFELFMEMRDNHEYLALKKEMSENEFNEEELRAKLFRQRLKRGPRAPSTKSQCDADSLSANARSMLVNHAKSLVEAGQDILMMTAQKRRAWTGNSYTISMPQSKEEQSSRSAQSDYLGKLKSNFGGTEFMLYEHGVRACSSADQSKQSFKQSSKTAKSVCPVNSPPHHRYVREAGMIQYDHFFEHTGSPIRIKVGLPNRSFHSDISVASSSSSSATPRLSKQWKSEQQALIDRAAATGEPLPDMQAAATPRSQAAESKASKVPASTLCLDEFDEYSYQTKGQQVEQFENLRPVWHDGMNAYVLHFDHHRVKEKSVKNFKLVRTLDGERKTVLQFGRVLGDRNVFVMDFSWPLSPFQAFAIALSSLDPKIAV